MASCFDFRLNGEAVRVEGLSPNVTLLGWLRANGRTGSKEGCAEGDCGACSVAVAGTDISGKPTYRAINSCLTPLILMADREVITVEGLKNECVHPVQEAMTEHQGSQCGYCTPGLIMSMFEGYYRKDMDRAWKLDDQLCGNLCRCTGYRPIRDAALVALQERKKRGADSFDRALGKKPVRLRSLEYSESGEKFFRPSSLQELFVLIKKHPTARLIAGATEMGVEIAKGFKKFPILVSIEAVAELAKARKAKEGWHLGAGLKLTDLADLVEKDFPEWARMLWVFGSRQIRNRATLGGNLVTASPIGDTAPVLLAHGATMLCATAKGERKVSADDFFVDYRRTCLKTGEILREVIVPIPMAKLGGRVLREWYKVSKRREMDISTVSACFVVHLCKDGMVTAARLAFGGVAATPIRAKKTEKAIVGKLWDEKTVEAACKVLATEFTPLSDTRGSREYRSEVLVSLLRKFFAGEGDGIDYEAPLSKASDPKTLPPPHESGHKHVSGEAVYADDISLKRENALEVWYVTSPHAKARIKRRDATEARKVPGVLAVLMAEDVSGLNNTGPVVHDEPLFADKEVCFHGQLIALVVGETAEICREAAAKVVVQYEKQKPILTVEEAIEKNSFHTQANFMRRGNAAKGLEEASKKMQGSLFIGGQEHFYLEMNAAFAEPGEDGAVHIASSTQHPTEVQQCVAHILHIPANKVVVSVPRMGGGFGGKETQAAAPAALAALAAVRTGRPVRVRFNRDQDMIFTGKRHPFLAKFEVGYDASGVLHAMKLELVSNGGWSLDLSTPVTDRAMFHSNNCYFIQDVEVSGRVAKTNLVSNTAFRGFGGPQGMLVIEEIMDRIARSLELSPEIVRERNFYRGSGESMTTHYGQVVEDDRVHRIWKQLQIDADVAKRRKEIASWNAKNPMHKRGIGMTPVMFGISFTLTMYNQAGALVHIYKDGSVQVNHGGTEMGQGIHTNIRTITCQELGLPTDQVRVMMTATDKVPNTSATAASSGTDLNGAAVKNALETLKVRLRSVAAGLLQKTDPEKIEFKDGKVGYGSGWLEFTKVAEVAIAQRISLSSTGYYRTPDIHWDRVKGFGKPFYYFAVGAAVSEVEVDGFTGETRVRRVDILHDVGQSINEGINRGQIEGGFIQGMGWLTAEELVWSGEGRLLTHSPDTYKIPAIGDVPKDFRVKFYDGPTGPTKAVKGSKAVGEPPLMLAISVREGIKDAVAAFGGEGPVELAVPSTGEAVFLAIRKRIAA
ncbi:MAG: xanthine dehydrogenase molybdopterin binding subunit [Verrucomicrobiota bacterium]